MAIADSLDFTQITVTMPITLSKIIQSLPILAALFLAVFFAGCLADTSESTRFDTRQMADNAAEIKWASIPAGCFSMGEDKTYREEAPVHEVCLDGFEISTTEITNGQFADFIRDTGYTTFAERGVQTEDIRGNSIDIPPGSMVFSPGQGMSWWVFKDGAVWHRPDGLNDLSPGDAHVPVVHIALEDALAFAAWAGGQVPSEAQWEYAARGGLDRALYAWEEIEDKNLSQKANTWQGSFPVVNTKDDGFEGIAPVAGFPPNGYGVYDMIGNVWELTRSAGYPDHDAEKYAANYPKGYDRHQPNRPVNVIKGGSFLCAKSYCYRYRPAARQFQDHEMTTSHIGFRIIRPIAD
jgi:formylglycine-generating enzyme required for sulfatase activity